MIKKLLLTFVASTLLIGHACGQTVNQRRMLSTVEDDDTSPYHDYLSMRDALASNLGLKLDQLGDLVETVKVGDDTSMMLAVVLKPEGENTFQKSETSKFQKSIENQGLQFISADPDEDNPNYLDLIFELDADESAVADSFASFRKNVASTLGWSTDQIGDIVETVTASESIYDIDIFPASGFDDNQLKELKKELKVAYGKPVFTDLKYDDSVPEALDLTLTYPSDSGDVEVPKYGDGQNILMDTVA